MGSGMATIRDPNPIKLGEFHTVELHRNLTLGSLRVDGGEAINGSSQVRLPVSLPWLHSRFKMVIVKCTTITAAVAGNAILESQAASLNNIKIKRVRETQSGRSS